MSKKTSKRFYVAASQSFVMTPYGYCGMLRATADALEKLGQSDMDIDALRRLLAELASWSKGFDTEPPLLLVADDETTSLVDSGAMGVGGVSVLRIDDCPGLAVDWQGIMRGAAGRLRELAGFLEPSARENQLALLKLTAPRLFGIRGRAVEVDVAHCRIRVGSIVHEEDQVTCKIVKALVDANGERMTFTEIKDAANLLGKNQKREMDRVATIIGERLKRDKKGYRILI